MAAGHEGRRAVGRREIRQGDVKDHLVLWSARVVGDERLPQGQVAMQRLAPRPGMYLDRHPRVDPVVMAVGTSGRVPTPLRHELPAPVARVYDAPTIGRPGTRRGRGSQRNLRKQNGICELEDTLLEHQLFAEYGVHSPDTRQGRGRRVPERISVRLRRPEAGQQLFVQTELPESMCSNLLMRMDIGEDRRFVTGNATVAGGRASGTPRAAVRWVGRGVRTVRRRAGAA